MPADLQPVEGGVVQDGSALTYEALRLELTRRTSEVAALRVEVAALTAHAARATLNPQVMEWKAKAAEYDALMATKTMHAVRIPRAIYGRILARRAGT
ncbi:MAG TPA: hypothetical protein VGP36_25785 [Mycobacteriales bacterium]|jgi:hypothetical protein|nr:hypothetical protein [Mycobacteriales bacterium]